MEVVVGCTMVVGVDTDSVPVGVVMTRKITIAFMSLQKLKCSCLLDGYLGIRRET